MKDNYDLWVEHEAKQEKKLKKLPVCCECGEHIQSDYAFYINDDWVCEECMESYKREVILEE